MADADTGPSNPGTSTRVDPLVGRRLASYEVLARVARGGMGVVYRARHVYIDKIVALKVLDPALASRTELIERFRTEAQSLARVEHENVVKVIDILEDKGVHFIVMDFAEGTNLRNYVKQKGPMSPDELLSVARQTAEALYAAHREGILHRDIKPENLIMNSRGRCKLADFGLAGDLRLISEGHEGPLNFGTPAYSAPEVLRRMVPDKRSDIFAFGATIYFLATGEPPFGQTGSQQIMLRQTQGAELLESRRPDLGAKFAQLMMDCIQLHPKDRPESFIEVLERLPRRQAASRTGAVSASTTGLITGPTTGTTTRGSTTGTTTTAIGVAGIGTSDTTGTLEEAPAGIPLIAWVGVAVLGIVGLAAVLAIALRGNTVPEPQNTAAQNKPSNLPIPRGNTTGNAYGNTPPANKPDGPAFNTENDAFNAAELDSRSALSRADYVAAHDAWARFLRDYPGSTRALEARQNRDAVLARVTDLRSQEYEKARIACEAALKEKRTADALAALDRFPPELLLPVGNEAEVAVAGLIDTQRQVVIAAEASDLARVLEQADKLRTDWKADYDNRDRIADSIRARTAGNLLAERDLLDGFMLGRTQDAREKVDKRLAGLRKQLETVHQGAQKGADEWRSFHDQTLGLWAAQSLDALERAQGQLRNRDFKQARKTADAQLDQIAAAQKKLVAETTHSLAADRIRKSNFVQAQLEAFRADLAMAERLDAVVIDALRDIRTAATAREVHVHAELNADGSRSERTIRYHGRVVSVGADNFVIVDNDQRVTLKLEMLTNTTILRLARLRSGIDEQLSLIAWLAAVGEVAEFPAELQRLQKIDRLPAAMLDRGQVIIDGGCLGPVGRRNLWYVAARAGQRTVADYLQRYDDGGQTTTMLKAQQATEQGDAGSAQTYLLEVHLIADPELVQLATFERALQLATPALGDLKNRTILEPLHAAAHAELALALLASNQRPEAVLAADKALLLDGSNDKAWRAMRR